MRNRIVWGMLVVILLLVNTMIFSKEGIVRTGQIMLLELAPRDPRSLMQGDYMALNYSLAREIARAEQLADDGYIVVLLNADKVAKMVRFHDKSQELQQGEYLLRYRNRGGLVKLATDAYFFEEGQWKTYRPARYGELRVNESGTAVLTGLRDKELRRLGESLQ